VQKRAKKGGREVGVPYYPTLLPPAPSPLYRLIMPSDATGRFIWYQSIYPPYNWKKDYGVMKRGRTQKTGTAKKQRTSRAIRPAQRGFVQTSGFYGRYARNGTVGAELKFHDLDIDDAVVAANGTIAQVSCNLIAQGVTESQRIGRKCTIRNINWRYQIQLPNAQNMTSVLDTVRVILYQDKQANGATATVTGILESDDFQSFNNLANKGRFTILMDRTHAINATAGSGNGTANDVAR
jgi:hypothetical protein